MKAFLIGLLASFFFAVTFVLNELMATGGGSWIWSASLRYLFMIPFLLGIVGFRKNWRPLWGEMAKHPWQWLLWSHVGFGLFYAPLCFSAAYSPAWLVAGTWQFTIIAGSLLAPFFFDLKETGAGLLKVRRKIPVKGMGMSLIILLGIGLMEGAQAGHVRLVQLLLGTVPILVAAFAYPLGNRKMMELCEGRLDAFQRTLGMTLASLPLWIVLSIFQIARGGLPSTHQTIQALFVALSSGVVATVLFFKATDLSKNNLSHLAAIEATQSGEVVFATLGEWWLLPGTVIGPLGLSGLILVVLGMILHSVFSSGIGKKNEDLDKAEAG